MSLRCRHCYGVRLIDCDPASAPFRLWNLLILDIRTKEEFDTGRLPPALHLDLCDLDWKQRVIDLTASSCSASAWLEPDHIGTCSGNGRAPEKYDGAREAPEMKNGKSGNEAPSVVETAGKSNSGRDSEELSNKELSDSEARKRKHQVEKTLRTYHICIMAGDSSEKQSRLAHEVHCVLTKELFLK